jgi:lysophospholipase L1-like esterase
MTDSVYPNLIVCGDSMAVGTGKDSPCLAASLRGYFPNLQRIGNQGLTAQEIHECLTSPHLTLPSTPCIVVVTFGTNDVATGVGLETTIAHTGKILNHFTSQGHHVIGVPPYPFYRLPLVEAVLNNWQGEYENTQDIQTYFGKLPPRYKAFKNKSPHEITMHADDLIAGIWNVFKEEGQTFLSEIIEGVRDKPFEERKRSFQFDGIHPTKEVYGYIARLIQQKIKALELQFMSGQSPTDRSPSS